VLKILAGLGTPSGAPAGALRDEGLLADAELQEKKEAILKRL
jgi:hypothetical protein